MRRFFGKLGTLESRFYLIFTLVFFTTILTMQIISTRFTITSVRSAILENNRLLLEQLVEQIDTYIDGMDRISEMIVDDIDAQAFLIEGSTNSKKVLKDRFASYLESRDDISGIVLFRMDGDAVSGDGTDPGTYSDYQQADWYRNALAAQGQTVVSTAYVQNLIPGQYSWVVSLSTLITSREDTTPLGILLVDLKFNRIKELCQSLVVGAKGYSFIIDPAGNYVFHPLQQLVYSDLKQEPVDQLLPILDAESAVWNESGKNYLTDRSDRTGWYVVSVSFDSDAETGWPYVQMMNALIGLVLFIIVGLVTNFITRGVTKPLRQLQSVMRSVETGEFRQAGSLEGTDEIRELAREYDIMVGHIGKLMEQNVKEQELKRKSDLKALQAQINPHFLYNTLDSIIWMGEMNKNDAVVKMTSALSRLFRISISKGRELIPLRDELEHVRSYLTIQEMRYKDKFRYLIDIPEELMDFTVLKITLQPLVENAIYHGIRSVDYVGLIEIAGRSEGGDLIMTVKDNGEGMDVEQLASLLDKIDDEEVQEKGNSGTGVRNVHERIRLYFGPEYGLDYESRNGVGTTISIRIPAQRRDAD
ncbi:MAG: sensor histidine kinase [Spirochaetaceae bacterium]|nr:sensor histidine kinase [Spirochaetaceae bacterium]